MEKKTFYIVSKKTGEIFTGISTNGVLPGRQMNTASPFGCVSVKWYPAETCPVIENDDNLFVCFSLVSAQICANSVKLKNKIWDSLCKGENVFIQSLDKKIYYLIHRIEKNVGKRLSISAILVINDSILVQNNLGYYTNEKIFYQLVWVASNINSQGLYTIHSIINTPTYLGNCKIPVQSMEQIKILSKEDSRKIADNAISFFKHKKLMELKALCKDRELI